MDVLSLDSSTPEDARPRLARTSEAGGEPPSPWPLVVALCAAGIFVSYADRSNISVAVLSMAAEVRRQARPGCVSPRWTRIARA